MSRPKWKLFLIKFNIFNIFKIAGVFPINDHSMFHKFQIPAKESHVHTEGDEENSSTKTQG